MQKHQESKQRCVGERAGASRLRRRSTTSAPQPAESARHPMSGAAIWLAMSGGTIDKTSPEPAWSRRGACAPHHRDAAPSARTGPSSSTVTESPAGGPWYRRGAAPRSYAAAAPFAGMSRRLPPSSADPAAPAEAQILAAIGGRYRGAGPGDLEGRRAISAELTGPDRRGTGRRAVARGPGAVEVPGDLSRMMVACRRSFSACHRGKLRNSLIVTRRRRLSDRSQVADQGAGALRGWRRFAVRED